ncbi:hypothetical protein, partial [Paracidovorax avenae]|uniref:hypothetical protein n=1 Tax=Paracidovorax avenae TaxID=80867 RepID=UPI001CEFAE95
MSAIAPTARSAFRACVVAAIRDGEAMMEALVAQTRDALEAEAPLAQSMEKTPWKARLWTVTMLRATVSPR